MEPTNGEQGPPLTLNGAEELLEHFDVADDPLTKALLVDVLTSGAVPREEVDQLRRLSSLPIGYESESVPAGLDCIGIDGNSKRRKKNDESGQKGQGKRNRRKVVNRTNEANLSSPFFEHDVDDSDQSSGETSCVQNPTRLVAVFTTTTVLNAQPVVAVVCENDDPFVAHDQEQVSRNGDATPGDGEPETSATPGRFAAASIRAFETPPPPPPSSHRTDSEAASSILQSSPLLSASPNEPSLEPSPFANRGTPREKKKKKEKKRELTSHFFTSSPSRAARRWTLYESNGENRAAAAGLNSTPTPTPKRAVRGAVSSLPFAPLTAARFGLVQEELAHDPFWLLVALVFLVRVSGRLSLPLFWRVKAAYPTAEALADASPRRLVAVLQPLGMASVRCSAIQRYARQWLERPPRAGVCSTVKKYPQLPEEAEAQTATAAAAAAATGDSAWEIGHLTQGAYFVDSWRIFCRDALLGRSTDWQGGGGDDGDDGGGSFQPEWMRVLPRDKELRACLRWMWMKEGWDWNPLTGDRTVLHEDLRRAVDDGRVGYDASGQLQILDMQKRR